MSFLNELKLFDDEANEDLVWVEETVVDPQLHQLGQEVQHGRL